MLVYYWSNLGFNSVELNFTYYSIPSYKTVVSMLRKTPQDFMFSVKVPGHVTHEGWKEDLDADIVKSYSKALEPMLIEGRLLSHLAQFPYTFKFSKKRLEYLKKTSDMLHPLTVEFRHNSWDREEVYEFLRKNGITCAIVDEPKMRNLFPHKIVVTTDTAYFRFHGRNERWFDRGSDRYDYLYTEEDIRRFSEDIKEISSRVRRILIYFNNCHNGKAVKNALKLKELLSI